MHNEQMQFMPTVPYWIGNETLEDLQREAADLRDVAEDRRRRWAERQDASARLTQCEQEIQRRRFDGRTPQRQAAHQAATAREGEYAETVPYFAAPRNAQRRAARTILVEDFWTNALGEIVVAHTTGLLRLPAGTAVTKGQELTVG